MSLDNKFVDLWHHGGIERVEDCFDNGLSMTFDHLKQKYNLSNQTLFHYIQLRSFLKANLCPVNDPACHE